MTNCYPIRFIPIYRNYMWGGDRILKKYQRTELLVRVAESWELSDRKDGMSLVANGSYQGQTLRHVIEQMGEDLLGLGRDQRNFPLLIKILDARESLSVQVHPNPITAPLVQGESKNEMWYVLDAQPKAMVYAGLKPYTTQNALLQALDRGTMIELLQAIEVSPNDAIYVPGGCVHAICAGCLMLEVQQNSDTTYRIYDWDRKDVNGKLRDLHIDKALATIDWSHRNAKASLNLLNTTENHTIWSVISSPDFQTQRIDIYNIWMIPNCPDTFQIVFCISGRAIISVDGHNEPLEPGMTYLIPASFSFGEIAGSCQIMRIFL